ncbi:MAG: HDIG domain-containing protein [Lachnospiraceae bacterium]|nr:HDIG domain-containing protein [Lachnospiraceae bacterium]
MDTQENRGRGLVQRICLYLAPLLSVAVHDFLERDTLQTLFSNGVFMVLLSSGYLVFLRTSGKELYRRIRHQGIFWGCFMLSFLFLGICPVRNVGVLWLLVVAFAAMEAGLELAVSLHVLLMTGYVILVLMEGGDLYAFAVVILFGFLLATLFSLYRTREATVYLAVILLAVDGVLQLVRYRLNMHALLAHGEQIAVEMAGILVMVFLGYFYLRYLQSRGQVAEKKEPGMASDQLSERQLLERLLEEEFSLAVALREYSRDLYHHSSQVSDLAGRAADAIGGDGLLARAGGLYHEMGRMAESNNYIEAGIALGEKHAFPEELQAVIRQHSPNYEIPKSPEAAVVMLSDCIFSTSDYLTKNGMREKLTDEKLVHNVIQNRLSKGNLRDSGMTVEQLEVLQAYFTAHAFEKGDA